MFYSIVGRTPTPTWDSLSSPSARELHGLIMDELRPCAKQVVVIEDVWVGVRVQLPELDQPSDKGYRFGYVDSVHDPRLNLGRSGILTDRPTSLVCKISENGAG